MSEVPATRRSRLFYLRISTSVFFGLLTVALCVLWIRGYFDNGNSWYGFESQSKCYSLNWSSSHFGVFSVLSKDHGQGNDAMFLGGKRRSRSDFQGVLGFRGLVFDNGWSYTVPAWFLVVICSAISLTLWHPYSAQFSLRTMLIATTLVAGVLGLGVWMTR